VSVAAFHEVFGRVTVSGCWFRYSQAVLKHVNKLSLEEGNVKINYRNMTDYVNRQVESSTPSDQQQQRPDVIGPRKKVTAG